MDARLIRCAASLFFVLAAVPAVAATWSTPNFEITAPSEEIARQCGECAEYYRKDLAELWLGKALPNWYRRCPITVQVGQVGAGGETTFTFDKGEVFGWKMRVQGPLERILDSVIPHEVNHTIFACHFRRPLPRWADEGAATLIEHESERKRQTLLLDQVIHTSRRIPLNELLKMTEYPREMQQVLTLYAEGYSLATYLVESQGDAGRAIYLKFLQDAHEQGWEQALLQHYGFESISALESLWTDWVLAGSPSLTVPKGQLLANGAVPVRLQADNANPAVAMNTVPNNGSGGASGLPPGAVVRSQSPAELAPLAATPRRLRTRPIGAGLNAPEPNVAAMPAADSASAAAAVRDDDSRFASTSELQPLAPAGRLGRERRTLADLTEGVEFPQGRAGTARSYGETPERLFAP